jgi:predicted phage-related endonuclease
MTAQALAVRQGTDEWREERINGLGSSDMPIVAGEKDGLLALWAVKAGLMEPEQPDERTAKLFRWGHLMEPVIAQAYTEETGRPLVRVNRMLQSRDWPVARASLDRRSAVKGERRGVEVKNTRSPRWDRYEAVPGDVQVQTQWQCYVAGLDVVDVAVLVAGSDLRIFEVERDDAWIGDLLYLARDFWDHVQAKTRPSIDGSESTRRTLARLHPRDDGEMLPLSPEFEELARQLVAAKLASKAAEDAEGTVSNAIRAMLGDASGVEGAFTYRKNRDSESVDYRAAVEAAAGAGIDLAPYLTAATVSKPGPRVLRLTWKGETFP